MTTNDVIRRVDEIRSMAGDNEAAHSAEDKLHADVLRAIARGGKVNAGALAAAALTTLAIEFDRWCA